MTEKELLELMAKQKDPLTILVTSVKDLVAMRERCPQCAAPPGEGAQRNVHGPSGEVMAPDNGRYHASRYVLGLDKLGLL